MPWLRDRAPDVLAAMLVLGRRSSAPGADGLVLRRVDLRRGNLAGTTFTYVDFGLESGRLLVPGRAMDRLRLP
jgi:hypothetical protein